MSRGTCTGLAALMLVTGCATLARPEPSDVLRAQAHWPDATLQSLQEGRRAYVARCANCHALHLPTSLPPEQWPAVVAEMEEDAKLQPGERELITRFLMTMAQRGKPMTADRGPVSR